MIPKPQFQKVTFSTIKQFDKWLKETTSKIIDIKDNGQDMQRIWIHESGEILHCDFNSGMYNGRFIELQKLAVDYPMCIQVGDEYQQYNGLIVEQITETNK